MAKSEELKGNDGNVKKKNRNRNRIQKTMKKYDEVLKNYESLMVEMTILKEEKRELEEVKKRNDQNAHSFISDVGEYLPDGWVKKYYSGYKRFCYINQKKKKHFYEPQKVAYDLDNE